MIPHSTPFKIPRKSTTEPGIVYFWTATINRWQPLLLEDTCKSIIIQSLRYLSEKNKIDVYAFVIMPTHIHLIWRLNELNGKETAKGSFLKYTAHEFKKFLLQSHGSWGIDTYYVDAKNKQFEFWKRDSLAISLFSPEVAFQKLEYIHNNPLAAHWSLADEPCKYRWSSACFYERGESEFEFLKDLRMVIG